MGKRCRWAALGATFALLVAACAAPTSSQTSSSATAETTGVAAPTATTATESTSVESTTDELAFADTSSDEGFLRPPSDGSCSTTNHSSLVILHPTTGEERAALPLPRPAQTAIVEESTAFIAFSWDQDQRPGVGAVDLTTPSAKWQRLLNSEPENLAIVDDALIVVSPEDVRALDPETGEDLWILDSQFDLRTVVVGSNFVFALDQVGVHAIDAATGVVQWQLPIDRPDTLAASDTTLAVASATRLIGVDIDAQTRQFDIDVDRSGAGELWIASESIVHELSTTVAPGGGIAAIDSKTGREIWRSTTLGEPVFAGADTLVASTANAEPSPGAPFLLFGVDANTGEQLWETPSTAQSFNAVIGATNDRVAIIQPHEVVPGLKAVRLFDLHTGEMFWEVSTDIDVDGAAISGGNTATLFASSRIADGDRGTIARRGTDASWWTATTIEGVTHPPMRAPQGIVVIAGERSPVCVGRSVGQPVIQTAVLGATETAN